MSKRITGDSLWFLNGHVTIHLSSVANSDGVSITEHLLPPDFGPPFHVHHDEDEIFYILEGEFRYKLGDAIRHAQPGQTVLLEKGVPHGFRVVSPSGGRCLIIARGGFEDMLRRASRSAKARGLPEQVQPTPDDLARLARICAENGIDLLGPPID